MHRRSFEASQLEGVNVHLAANWVAYTLLQRLAREAPHRHNGPLKEANWRTSLCTPGCLVPLQHHARGVLFGYDVVVGREAGLPLLQRNHLLVHNNLGLTHVAATRRHDELGAARLTERVPAPAPPKHTTARSASEPRGQKTQRQKPRMQRKMKRRSCNCIRHYKQRVRGWVGRTASTATPSGTERSLSSTGRRTATHLRWAWCPQGTSTVPNKDSTHT